MVSPQLWGQNTTDGSCSGQTRQDCEENCRLQGNLIIQVAVLTLTGSCVGLRDLLSRADREMTSGCHFFLVCGSRTFHLDVSVREYQNNRWGNESMKACACSDMYETLSRSDLRLRQRDGQTGWNCKALQDSGSGLNCDQPTCWRDSSCPCWNRPWQSSIVLSHSQTAHLSLSNFLTPDISLLKVLDSLFFVCYIWM